MLMGFSCDVPVVLVIVKLKLIFLDVFSKNTQMLKFHEAASSGNRVVPCGHRQTHDEDDSRF